MRILFLTTFNVDFEGEHYFTKNVIKELIEYCGSHDIEFVLGSVISDTADGTSHFSELKFNDARYCQLHIGRNITNEETIAFFAKYFSEIKPDVIHSQMVEGFDVQAAQQLSIPIVLTIHIGGIICPRGGGNGFLTDKDTICDRPVGSNCAKCIMADFPLRFVSPIVRTGMKLLNIERRLADRQPSLFYFTPLANIDRRIDTRRQLLSVFKYAHIVAADKKLVDLLTLNGLNSRIHLLPHGVRHRDRLPLPEVISGKIKFYILGRIQKSKGIIDVLEAFRGVDNSKYELHIIGDAESSRREQRYMKKVEKMAEGLNVVFHGRLPNEEIESVIKDCHVMIHAAKFLEIYGIAIAESLSMGRPVIATRCGGAEMQVRDNINGWLIDPNDIESLRDVINSILENPELIGERSKNCELPHPIEEYVEKLTVLYRSIAQG